jgi:hypothetical protein
MKKEAEMVTVVVEVVEVEVEVEEEEEEEAEEAMQEVYIQVKYPYLLLAVHTIVRHLPILAYQPGPPRKAK